MEVFLVAERLKSVNGHLDYYGTPKLLQLSKHGGDAGSIKLSRLAKELQKDVRSPWAASW